MSHSRARRRAAGNGPPPARPGCYEDMGDLAGFPVVYDAWRKEWVVTINGERIRFDRQSVRDTTLLMYELYKDANKRDGKTNQ